MANKIITKNGTAAPTTAQCDVGELCFDRNAGKLYSKDSGGSIVEIGGGSSGVLDCNGTYSHNAPVYNYLFYNGGTNIDTFDSEFYTTFSGNIDGTVSDNWAIFGSHREGDNFVWVDLDNIEDDTLFGSHTLQSSYGYDIYFMSPCNSHMIDSFKGTNKMLYITSDGDDNDDGKFSLTCEMLDLSNLTHSLVNEWYETSNGGGPGGGKDRAWLRHLRQTYYLRSGVWYLQFFMEIGHGGTTVRSHMCVSIDCSNGNIDSTYKGSGTGTSNNPCDFGAADDEFKNCTSSSANYTWWIEDGWHGKFNSFLDIPNNNVYNYESGVGVISTDIETNVKTTVADYTSTVTELQGLPVDRDHYELTGNINGIWTDHNIKCSKQDNARFNASPLCFINKNSNSRKWIVYHQNPSDSHMRAATVEYTVT